MRRQKKEKGTRGMMRRHFLLPHDRGEEERKGRGEEVPLHLKEKKRSSARRETEEGHVFSKERGRKDFHFISEKKRNFGVFAIDP